MLDFDMLHEIADQGYTDYLLTSANFRIACATVRCMALRLRRPPARNAGISPLRASTAQPAARRAGRVLVRG